MKTAIMETKKELSRHKARVRTATSTDRYLRALEKLHMTARKLKKLQSAVNSTGKGTRR